MPKFLDHHGMGPNLPPEAKAGIAEQIKAGRADQFGVTGLNVFLTTEGEAYCLSSAPDADAVVKSHEALGFPIRRENVVEVASVI
jgi:Protein of unknown function (DUF4242)